MKNMMRIALKRGISWPGENLTGMGKEEGKIKVWDVVVKIFEMNKN